ncbi:MAG: hypothetical protein ACUVWR_09755 [Anaerolineae bacterium]
MNRTKPTVDSRFHIDLDWWEEQRRNFRVELLSHLCRECRDSFGSYYNDEMIDWVDPETGEVRRVDGLWHSLQSCCSQKGSFLSVDTSLATAVFRLFLANGNQPLSPVEIWQRLARRDPDTILRLLVKGRPYYGIRVVDRDN